MIAKVPGIDVLFVGPFDLGNNIGHPIINGAMHDELREAIAKVQRVAKENGKSSGIYSMSGDQARDFADQGFNMVSPWRLLSWMSSRCKRLALIDVLMLHSGVSDDGHGCTARVYDLCTECCERLLRPLCIESG